MYIYILMLTNTHTCSRTHTCTRTGAVESNLGLQTPHEGNSTCVLVQIYMHVDLPMLTNTHTCKHTHTCTHAHTHTHTRTQIHTHTHTHTRTGDVESNLVLQSFYEGNSTHVLIRIHTHTPAHAQERLKVILDYKAVMKETGVADRALIDNGPMIEGIYVYICIYLHYT